MSKLNFQTIILFNPFAQNNESDLWCIFVATMHNDESDSLQSFFVKLNSVAKALCIPVISNNGCNNFTILYKFEIISFLI